MSIPACHAGDRGSIPRLGVFNKPNEGKDAEKAFLDAYFKPRSNCQKELEVLKRFSIQLAIANSKISKRE